MTLNRNSENDSGGNVAPFPDLRAIEAEAAQWVALTERRDLTPDEQDAFDAWKAQSPQHRQVFAELAGVWAEFDGLYKLHDFVLPPDADERDEPAPASVTDGAAEHRREPAGAAVRRIAVARRGAIAAMAAGVALLAVGAVTVQTMRPSAADGPAVASYETALGEQQTFVLADGSAIMLNTASKAEVEFMPDARTIRLIRGEAHFDVAHDQARPFSVYAGENIVRALGTAFTVRVRSKDEVDVIVDEGRVAVMNGREAQEPDAASGRAAGPAPAGEVATGGAATVKGGAIASMSQLTNEELLRKLAWRQGRLSFAGEPLRDVIEEIGRYTDIDIEVPDEALERIPIGGAFRVGEVDEFLSALETGFGVRVTRISDKHIILARAS